MSYAQAETLRTENTNPRVSFSNGIGLFEKRLAKQKALYEKIALWADESDQLGRIVTISEPTLFYAALQTFGPALPKGLPASQKLYDVAFDRALGSLIIANRGATLWCLSPKTETPYLCRHIGLALYIPGLGLETVNVGLVGDVYSKPIAVRSESACTPSFLFGSQRCNCCHQWDSFLELAAAFNPSATPTLTKTKFEYWVQEQHEYKDGQHRFSEPGRGFVFLHLDSQNGMGSGVTSGEFSVDLFNRASLRHRGEYSAEQILRTSMAGGFRAIGLIPDPRSVDNNSGYQVTPLVLDYLGVNKNLIFLSNNKSKIKELTAQGYKVTRVKSIGAVNDAGALEAEERGTEFGHLDIDSSKVDFNDEFLRVKNELESQFAAQ